MLHTFLHSNREELASRCRAKVASRRAPIPTPTELEYGIPLFIGQLIETLRAEQTAGPGEPGAPPAELPTNIGTSAEKHGYELLRKGFTVDQVVHDYGDLCQAVTELAHEKHASISVDEFHTFNRCLDNAIADAVTEFGRARDLDAADAGAETMNERLGSLAHELRNQLNTAVLAFEAIRTGSVAMNGATGTLLDRSLTGLRTLIDRSLAEVRLTAGLQSQPESISLTDFFDEVRIPAVMEAKSKGLALSIVVAPDLMIHADRQMLSSAIANLLQNALKFTRANGHVELAARAVADRVVIEIKDECGGLPAGATEALFQPFEQRSRDRTGLGLGLSISRRSIEANGGTLSVRDLPGIGCVFAIDLPRATRAT